MCSAGDFGNRLACLAPQFGPGSASLVVQPAFAAQGGIVYVLPEVRSLALRSHHHDQKPHQKSSGSGGDEKSLHRLVLGAGDGSIRSLRGSVSD